jgi:hypothetical protein
VHRGEQIEETGPGTSWWQVARSGGIVKTQRRVGAAVMRTCCRRVGGTGAGNKGWGRTEGLHTGDAEEVESVSEGLRGRGHGAPEQSEDGAVGGGSRTVGQAEDCKGTVHDRGGDSTGVKIGPFHVRGSFLACSILHQLVSSYMP